MTTSSSQTTAITVAAFDFDGTITTKDSLFFFLIFTHGRFKTFIKLFTLLPLFIAYGLGLIARQSTKEKVLASFYAGTPLSQLQEKGSLFARSPQLAHIMRPYMLERITWHQAQGHQCILISASLDIYLAPWSQQQGFNALISSTLEITPEGTVTGQLKGLNCWGEEKSRRLEATLGPKKNYTLYAYGDSLGDKNLLALADYPFYRV